MIVHYCNATTLTLTPIGCGSISGAESAFGTRNDTQSSRCIITTPATNTPTATTTPISTVVPGSCNITVTNNPTVYFRLSPTRNSPWMASIPQNTVLTAVYRLDVTADEIWYQVKYNNKDGWVAAKIQGIPYINDSNCSSLPKPYPPNWTSIAQIEANEIPSGCNIDAYFSSEPAALVVARVAYAEAGIYSLSMTIPGTTTPTGSGGTVYKDATRAAWIMRMLAFLGYSNYNTGYAGDSMPIVDQTLAPGIFAPVDELRTRLALNGCIPKNITGSDVENILKMVYPKNTPSAPASGQVQLYELWLIYQDVQANVINVPWSNMPLDIRGFEQFKGIGIAEVCPPGPDADYLTRPGTGFPTASNQPYPPKTVTPYQDLSYGSSQDRLTCYQDTLHLDDWFWAVGINDIAANPSTNEFPRKFCVKDFVPDAQFPGDFYPLAQLPIPGGIWPPGTPNYPNCVPQP